MNGPRILPLFMHCSVCKLVDFFFFFSLYVCIIVSQKKKKSLLLLEHHHTTLFLLIIRYVPSGTCQLAYGQYQIKQPAMEPGKWILERDGLFIVCSSNESWDSQTLDQSFCRGMESGLWPCIWLHRLPAVHLQNRQPRRRLIKVVVVVRRKKFPYPRGELLVVPILPL